MCWKIFVLCVSLCCVYVDGFAMPFEGLYRLDVVHYNDFHARFEETSLATPICHFNNNSCLGGFPRLYHEIDVLLQEKPDAVLLNAGDSFQGTTWFTVLHWNVTQVFMNLLPIDAHALGNHEFDDGPEGLALYLKGLKAPVVAANMDTTNEPSLRGLYVPHVVVERKGRKIGIIGLITPDTKQLSSSGNVRFTDPGAATQREAQILTDKGVDIIILLSHCGIKVDRELARNYGHQIDIIVGGHSHSLLWTGDTPSGETAEGPYPVFVETATNSTGQKHEVLIVQASAYSKYLGNLSVYFDSNGNYAKWEGNPVFLNRSIEEDEEIKKKMEPYTKLVHEAENAVLGNSENTMHLEDCSFGECALGDLIVDGMVEYAKNKVDSNQNYVSFIQVSGIRASIMKGPIIQKTIFEMLPYKNRVVLFELQGRYLRDALERIYIYVSDAWGYHPFKSSILLQIAGLRVTYNVSQPEGNRITSLSVEDGSAVDADSYYHVISPQYLADGGGGFTMLKEHKQNVTTLGREADILTTYIRKHSPLNITTEGRITINQ